MAYFRFVVGCVRVVAKNGLKIEEDTKLETRYEALGEA